MLKVVSSFVLNGVEYAEGAEVDPAALEAEDVADLLARGLLLDPAAPPVQPPKEKKSRK